MIWNIKLFYEDCPYRATILGVYPIPKNHKGDIYCHATGTICNFKDCPIKIVKEV